MRKIAFYCMRARLYRENTAYSNFYDPEKCNNFPLYFLCQKISPEKFALSKNKKRRKKPPPI